MRIIKMSSEQGFSSPDDIHNFFETELSSRDERGKFRITSGRINGDSFRIGEMLIFSYQTIIYFIARSASALQSNNDDYREELPYFFIVDVDSIRHVEMTRLNDIERLTRKLGKKKINLVKSQAWPLIDDSKVTQEIWAFLEKRSFPVAGKIDEAQADLDDETLKENSAQGYFGGLYLAKQILSRRGQKKFRDALIKRYGPRCMISDCKLLDIIEAAHIVPFKDEKRHAVANGILLRSDLHTLFDLNLIGINPDTLEIFLSDKVRSIEEYQQFHKHQLALNEPVDFSKEYLTLKWGQFCEKHKLLETWR